MCLFSLLAVPAMGSYNPSVGIRGFDGFPTWDFSREEEEQLARELGLDWKTYRSYREMGIFECLGWGDYKYSNKVEPCHMGVRITKFEVKTHNLWSPFGIPKKGGDKRPGWWPDEWPSLSDILNNGGRDWAHWYPLLYGDDGNLYTVSLEQEGIKMQGPFKTKLQAKEAEGGWPTTGFFSGQRANGPVGVDFTGSSQNLEGYLKPGEDTLQDVWNWAYRQQKTYRLIGPASNNCQDFSKYFWEYFAGKDSRPLSMADRRDMESYP